MLDWLSIQECSESEKYLEANRTQPLHLTDNKICPQLRGGFPLWLHQWQTPTTLGHSLSLSHLSIEMP